IMTVGVRLLLLCVHVVLLRPGHRGADHSFPTRRSSDLCTDITCSRSSWVIASSGGSTSRPTGRLGSCAFSGSASSRDAGERMTRSEEHTSELQSREKLVCRLLLEKKTNRLETAQRCATK